MLVLLAVLGVAAGLVFGVVSAFAASGPTVSSINRASGAQNPTNAGLLVWTLTFSKPVKNVVAGDFAVVKGSGIAGTPVVGAPTANGGSAPQATWNVSVSTAGVTGALTNNSIGLNLTSRGSIQDQSGNALTTSSFVGQTFTYDTTPPPKPVIYGEPSNPTTSTSATLTFGDDPDNDGDTGLGDSDDEAGAVLWCSLTGPKPVALGTCTSPVTYSGLTAGPYTFSVYAVDPAGNKSGTTSYSWTVHALATTTITTSLSAGTVAIGTPVHDTSLLSGETSSAGGTVAYTVYPTSSACTSKSGGTPEGSETVTNGIVPPSSTFTPTSLSGYYWQAVYSGDGNNAGATSSCEQLTVTKTTPSLTTTPLPSSGPVGSALKDSATLAGSYATTGETVSFSLFSTSNCSTQVGSTVTGTLAANGTVTSSTGVTATSPITYYWKVSYGGDANNGAVSSCGEPVTVTKATPTLSTTPTPSSLVIGSGTVTDKATLSGGYGTLTGTITYKLYAPGDTTCSGSPLTAASSTVTVAGTYTSGPLTPTSAGTWNWIASYSSTNANDASVAGTCGSEQLNVSKATTTISTTPSPGVTVGGGVWDKASLTGSYSPTGSILFTLYSASSCSAGSQVFSAPGTISSGSASSTSYPTTAAGTYYWKAYYAGDANNTSFTTPCGTGGETVTVAKASPTFTTSATASVTVGATVSDTATFTGLVAPDGTGYVLFGLFGNAGCTGLPLFVTFAPVVSATAPVISGTYTTTAASPSGDHWAALYTGDGNNNPAVEGCGASGETSLVKQATPLLTTAPTPSTLVVGSGTVTDKATLSGGYGTLTGTVTYKLYAPGDTSCSGSPLVATPSTVTGAGTYTSGAVTPTSAGTWNWIASYSGDGNNAAVAGTCSNEPLTVKRATVTLSTSPTPASFVVGSGSVTDKATLSGGYGTLTGTITYTLYAPTDPGCSGTPTPLTATASTVSGTGTYQSGTLAPTTAGTWNWIASYSGDTNNLPVAGSCSNEPLTVTGGSGGFTVGPTGAPTFTVGVTNMVPGDSVTPSGPVTVTNTGAIPLNVVIYEENLVTKTCSQNGLGCPSLVGTGNLAGDLTLTIKDTTTGATVYDNLPLNGLGTSATPLALPGTGGPTWAPGESHQFLFTVSFPKGSHDNDFQGTSANLDFVWEATG